MKELRDLRKVHQYACIESIPVMFFWYILGIMELPITNISKPPKDSRLLRDIDYSFIATLKEKMLKYPSAPGASTVAVLCTDITAIEQFEIKYKNVYW